PKVSPCPRRLASVVGCAERGSDGPLRSFGIQRPPCFLNVRLSAANAVRWARSPSPYRSTALSCALTHVRCAFEGERRSVDGISFCPGIAHPAARSEPRAVRTRSSLRPSFIHHWALVLGESGVRAGAPSEPRAPRGKQCSRRGRGQQR